MSCHEKWKENKNRGVHNGCDYFVVIYCSLCYLQTFFSQNPQFLSLKNYIGWTNRSTDGRTDRQTDELSAFLLSGRCSKLRVFRRRVFAMRKVICKEYGIGIIISIVTVVFSTFWCHFWKVFDFLLGHMKFRRHRNTGRNVFRHLRITPEGGTDGQTDGHDLI